jgi:hypothetical protein
MHIVSYTQVFTYFISGFTLQFVVYLNILSDAQTV